MIKQWTGKFGAVVALMIVLSLGISESAHAYGGSWGSSRGGFGSGGGSWGGGGGGLLAGRRPLRNLLGIVGNGIGVVGDGIGFIGDRISNIGGGSLGGSQGGLLGGGGLRNRLFGGGSTGGWGSAGSTGSFSIGGGSAGSVGGGLGYSTWSSGLSYAANDSYGSTGGLSYGNLYSGAATENYYGDWGARYLSDTPNISYPISSFEASYPVANYYDGLSYNSGLVYGNIEDAYSSPISSVQQSTYERGSIVNGESTIDSYGVPGAVETGYDAPVLDYGASEIFAPSFDNSATPPQPGTIYGPVETGVAPGGGSNFGDGLPDAPIPDADADSTDLRKSKSKAILSLRLPREAKVYINGKLTKTQGAVRRYVSRNLSQGKNYRYRVKAVVNRDGRDIVRTKLVTMRPGQDRLVGFDFARPQVTTLVLKVPEDAEVFLDGQKTKAKGKIRTFSTRKLTDEQSWNGYKIEVRFLKDGKEVVETRTLNLIAGTKKMIALGGSSGEANRKAEPTAIARK